MRQLIFVPDMHNIQNLGVNLSTDYLSSVKDDVKEAERDAQIVRELVEQAIACSDLDFSKVKVFAETVFQDGGSTSSPIARLFPVPLSKTEDRSIYYEMAEVAQVLVNLLLGEEIPENEYQDEELPEALALRLDDLNIKRERAVAENINSELQDGEVGILIMGALHSRIMDNLAEDIEVEYLSPELRNYVEDPEETLDHSFYSALFEENEVAIVKELDGKER